MEGFRDETSGEYAGGSSGEAGEGSGIIINLPEKEPELLR